ncbi:MAG: DNA polymerase I [Candidatus Omnitrophica bacterium CG11_big_fil_rev_8_21_14_0_20_42_13]|uniref:DNA polymerase I n=1 Tax=Candidatus Ghiorseimicrobium undicola TaxID=1974746 RepID=A0A2H0LYX6_9BACT|nr:MAG: DNA polymerase I [Candidatus Omnitrophica bacterium CG11_big_fil_rev_8_21_14_0_20_42_13]
MPKPKLFLLDANSFCYRAFFAIKADLSTSYGQPTGAIFGFINILNKILKNNNPEYLSVCFDLGRDTFRRQKFADYKKTRPPMPDELISQIEIIKEVISAYNFHIFQKQGYEADDIIATIAKKAAGKFDVVIVSGDKDMLQLVDDNIKLCNPHNADTVVDKNAVKARFGVSPENIIDIVALTGDSIDNIPGVKGIGEKTAATLIKKYGNIDNLLSQIESIDPPRVRNMIIEQKEQLVLSRDLAVLDTAVPLDIDLAKLKVAAPDHEKLKRIFKKLEFRSMLKDLPASNDACDKAELIELEDKAEIKKFSDSLFADEAMVFLLDVEPQERRIQGVYFYNSGKVYFVKSGFLKYLSAVFSDKKIKKTGYNLKEAKILLSKEGIELCGIHFDTMLAAYLLNPASASYDLKDLISEYQDSATDKKISYPAAAISKLKDYFYDQLCQKKQEKLFFDVEMPLAEVLAEMEIYGIKIDLSVLSSLSKQIDKRISLLVEKIYKVSEKPFNINSPKQLRLVLFDMLKLPVLKKTKTGPSTDEEVLKKLTKSHFLPALILDYRQLVKLKSTYIDSLPKLVDKKDARLHSSFNQTGTQTGRLSSSNPNLQNIPIRTEDGRKIRLAFIPSGKDDYLLCCDYSQVELRILAHLSDDENLKRAFGENKDVHRFTASLIFTKPEQEITGLERDMAKRVNFGIIYGMTNFGLSRDLDISNEEAQKFIDEYFLRYPKVRRYIDQTIEEAKRNGFAATLLGRRRYLPQLNSSNMQLKAFAERQAINAPIQGTASDMIKLAMIKISREMKENNLYSKMVLQVHDELIFDVKNAELEKLCRLIKSNMENVLKLSVPLKVDMKKGKNWYNMEKF